MFNRSFQIRSRQARSGKSGLVPVSEILQELVERAARKESFYRPAKQVSPKSPRRARRPSGPDGRQLELPFATAAQAAPAIPVKEAKEAGDPARPLFDLFPEAYE
jgi:hypothetical protein